jgi:hypothetical protein
MSKMSRQEGIWIAWERFRNERDFLEIVVNNTMRAESMVVVLYGGGAYEVTVMHPRFIMELPEDCLPLEVPYLECDKSKGIKELWRVAREQGSDLKEEMVKEIYRGLRAER